MVKILVAEDEAVIRKGIIAILKRELKEAEFFEAEDGREGMEVYNRELPSIIITDIRMPECDGLEMIERINGQSSQPPGFLVISGYSDFSYAKQAMQLGVHDYILKPIDKPELINTIKTLIARSDEVEKTNSRNLKDTIRLREATKDLRRRELMRLMGEASEKEYAGIINKLRDYDISLDDDMYICVTADYQRGDDPELESFSMENIYLETMDSISRGSVFFFDDCGRMVLIIPGSDAIQLNMLAEKAALRCLGNLQKFMPVKFFFGIGEAVCLPANIRQSYQQSVSALRFKIFDPDMCIMNYKRLKQGKRRLFNTDWREVFETLMENGQKSAVRLMMDGLDMTPSSALVDALEERQENMRKRLLAYLPGGAALPELPLFESNWSIAEWRKHMGDFLVALRDACVENENGFTTKKSALDILNFMEMHVGEELTLTTIAERFDYNPSYISAMLKKETGKNFTRYLTELRVGLAKKLLKETRLSAKEIAQRAGYQDSAYFNQVFKRETGRTPMEYRNAVI